MAQTALPLAPESHRDAPAPARPAPPARPAARPARPPELAYLDQPSDNHAFLLMVMLGVLATWALTLFVAAR